ncbi:MAG: PAS domain S-box protein, partial [Planctomycetaceae bacterium]|nr:PAS domain S-box protein [Planctomycetaceae bacterium]
MSGNTRPTPDIADDLLRATLFLPNVLVFTTDADGVLTYTDGYGLAGLGMKPGDGIGQLISKFLGGDEEIRSGIERALNGETLVTTSCIRGRYLERRITPSIGPTGNVERLIEISTDITERRQAEEDLIAQRDLLHNIFDSIPEITHILDRNYKIVLANKASLDIFSDRTVIGATCYKMISELDHICTWCPVAKTYETGLPSKSEFYDDLRDRYQALSCFPIHDSEGNFIGAAEMAFDVTETRKAQEALRKSDALLSDLFSGISDGILIIDKDYTILRMNPALGEFFDAHLLLVGKKCYTLRGHDRVCPDCTALEMYRLEKTVTAEHHRPAFGSIPDMWVEHTTSPLFDKETGQMTGAIVVLRNVTQRKQVEVELNAYRTELEKLVDYRTNELKLSEAKLRTMLETSLAPVSFIDWQGNFTYINKAYESLFGYSESELYGRSALMFSAGTDEDHQGFWSLLKGKSDYNRVTTQLYTKDGQARWVDISASVVRSTDSKETQLICVIVDVTDRQRILEELQHAKNAADAANRAKSEFLAHMSHEIRTPLNGVIGLSDLLLGTELNEKQLEYAQLINVSGKSLLFLINDILDFSKIEAGKLELDIEQFDLIVLVESVLGILASRAEGKSLALCVSFAYGLPRFVLGDSGRIRQILINLVGNAIKFTETGGVRVKLSLGEWHDDAIDIQFVIKDTGIGITEDRMERLFKSFSQANSSSSRIYGGTGLGLAISRQLTRLMGGDIDVESKPGQGSVFQFVLPLRCHPTMARCISENRRICVAEKLDHCAQTKQDCCVGINYPGRAGGHDIRGRRILLVDGNAVQRESLDEQLTTWGFSTTLCETRREAMALLTGFPEPFDLLIVDSTLGDGSGEELIRETEKIPAPTRPKIIFLVPLSDQNTENSLPDVFRVTKPVFPSTFFDTIMNALFERNDGGGTVSSRNPSSSRETRRVPSAMAGRVHVLVAEDNRINQIVAKNLLEEAGLTCDIVGNGYEACAAVRQKHYDIVLMD